MTSFALSILFLFQLVLAMVLAWQWISLRQRIRTLEARLEDSLDDQDLAAFQDTVSGLITDIREASEESENRANKALQALERAIEKAQSSRDGLTGDAWEPSEKRLDPRFSRALKQALLNKKTDQKKPPAERPKPKPAAAKISELPKSDQKTVVGSAVSSAPKKGAKEQVHTLDEMGKSKAEIAAETGLLPGEVELILSLKSSRKPDA